jgi:hypothetical protein
MAAKPPAGAPKPGEGRGRKRDSSHPADKRTDPQTNQSSEQELAERRRLAEREAEERRLRREREFEERRRRRERVEGPAPFVAEPQAEAERTPPRELEPRVFAFSGSLFVAVRREYAAEPLRDPEARIGVCDAHPLPPSVAIEDNPCPYQLSAYFVATTPVELRQAICEEILAGSPDMSRRKLLRSIERHWVIVRLDADAVRCGWLFDDPTMPGGEPQLRHDGQRPASRDSGSWRRVREMLDRDVAMLVLGGDRAGSGRAQRMLIFCVPGLALTKVAALRWSEARSFSEFEGWRGLGRGIRPATAPLPYRQPLPRRLYSELKYRLRMWRGNRGAAKAERRERRDLRRRESAARWAVRREIIEGLGDCLALIREAAETAILIAKAIIVIGAALGGPPALVLLASHLLANWK